MAYTGLVRTTFMAGPDQAQSAADIYAASSDVVVKSKQAIDEVAAGVPAVDTLIKPKELTSLLTVTPQILPDSVRERLTTGAPDIKNCFKNFGDFSKLDFKIPTGLVDKITSTVNGVTSKLKGIVGSAGDAFNKLKDFKGFGNFKGISCATNTLTDGKFITDLVDKGGIAGLVSGLTIEGSKIGLNNVFSSISTVVKDKDILLGAVTNIMPNAMKDVNLLKDLASTSIGKEIKKIVPDVSKVTIAGFKIDTGIKQPEYKNVYNTTSSTLSSIDDAWNTCTRDVNKILDGSLITGLKLPDFHNVMEAKVMSTVIPFPNIVKDVPILMPTYDMPEMFLMTTKGLDTQSVDMCLAKDFPTVPVVLDPPILVGSPVEYSKPQPVDGSTQITDTSLFAIEPSDLKQPLTTPISDTTAVSILNVTPKSGTEVGTLLGTSIKYENNVKIVSIRTQGEERWVNTTNTSYDVTGKMIFRTFESDWV